MGQLVIAGGRLQAVGALGADAGLGLEGDLDLAGAAFAVAQQADVVVNEANKVLNGVEQGLNLELQSWSVGPGRALNFYSHNAG